MPFIGSLPAGDWNVDIASATQQGVGGAVTFHFLKPGVVDLRCLVFSGQTWQTTLSFPPNTSFFCIEVSLSTTSSIGQIRLQKGPDIRTVDFVEDAKFVWQVIWP